VRTMKRMRKLVKGVPALAAIIDKTVDYVVGVGYYVSVTNGRGGDKRGRRKALQ